MMLWHRKVSCIAGPLCEGIIWGGRLNKKDGLSRYGDSHVKDKMS